MEPYYKVTRPLADALKVMYEVIFPDLYDSFRAAFEAGRWFQEDPGPWLGRAIVYKLQVDLHRDTNDIGPSVSFPCGHYKGGEMMIPQLKSRFRCVSSLNVLP